MTALAERASIDAMPYYREHWESIEAERLERYDQFFQWSPQMQPLIEGLPWSEARVAVDYGCGPGWVALELARRLGPEGRVIGCDINEDFLARASEHALLAGLEGQVEWLHVSGDQVPLEDGASDIVFCKNVLEYVDSMVETLREFRRVLRPGGVARLIDSDWEMLVVEPLGAGRVRELFQAARHAYNDPAAGRHMFGAARASGFADVQVRVAAMCDTKGILLPPLYSITSYAVESGNWTQENADSFIGDVNAAVDRNEFLAVLPQFIVTAVAP